MCWAARNCEEFSMPFFLIPTALGVCFVLIWAFIGGMIFRDSRLAAQSEFESGAAILPLAIHRAPRRPKMRGPRKKRVSFAS
jgi:hypothetical protein